MMGASDRCDHESRVAEDLRDPIGWCIHPACDDGAIDGGRFEGATSGAVVELDPSVVRQSGLDMMQHLHARVKQLEGAFRAHDVSDQRGEVPTFRTDHERCVA